jgi:hypothetical protein
MRFDRQRAVSSGNHLLFPNSSSFIAIAEVIFSLRLSGPKSSEIQPGQPASQFGDQFIGENHV